MAAESDAAESQAASPPSHLLPSSGARPHVPGFTEAELYTVAGVSPGSAWAAGLAADRHGLYGVVEHWDGTAWTQVLRSDAHQRGAEFYGASAAGVDDVWAVGDAGTGSSYAMHWNGTRWSDTHVPKFGYPYSSLDAAMAIAPDDVWAVGEFMSKEKLNFSAAALHWDGTTWTNVPVTVGGATGSQLLAVDAKSSDDVWAAGVYWNGGGAKTYPLVMHWDGTTWVQVKSPKIRYAWFGDLVEMSSDDVYALYPGAPYPRLERYDGSAWHSVPLPKTYRLDYLAGIAANSDKDIWLVGSHGLGGKTTEILHWNGHTWKRLASPNEGKSPVFYAVAASGPDAAWAVGDYQEGQSTYELRAVWDGQAWTEK